MTAITFNGNALFLVIGWRSTKIFCFPSSPRSRKPWRLSHKVIYRKKNAQHARPFYVHENISPQNLVRALLPSTRVVRVGLCVRSFGRGFLPMHKSRQVSTLKALLDVLKSDWLPK